MSNRSQAVPKSCILRCTGKYAIILLSIHICRRKGGCGCGVQYGGISVSLFPRGVSSLPAHAGTPDEERLRKVICELFLLNDKGEDYIGDENKFDYWD